MIYNMFMFHAFVIFRTPKNGVNFGNLATIAHKIAKPKHFVSTENEPDSPINFLSSDMYFVRGGDGALHHLPLFPRPLLFAEVCINAIVVLGNAKESTLTSNDCVTIRKTVLFSFKTNIINRK